MRRMLSPKMECFTCTAPYRPVCYSHRANE